MSHVNFLKQEKSFVQVCVKIIKTIGFSILYKICLVISMSTIASIKKSPNRFVYIVTEKPEPASDKITVLHLISLFPPLTLCYQ